MSRRQAESSARLHAIGVGDPVQPRELRHGEAAALRDLAETFARADLVEVRRRERRRRRGLSRGSASEGPSDDHHGGQEVYFLHPPSNYHLATLPTTSYARRMPGILQVSWK